MISIYRFQFEKQRGGIIVEASLIITFLLLLTFAIIESANMLYKYSLLIFEVEQVAHDYSTREDLNCSPPGASNDLTSDLQTTFLSKLEDLGMHGVVLKAQTKNIPLNRYGPTTRAPVLFVEAKWPLNCLLCNVFPQQIVFSTLSFSLLEGRVTC